MNKLRVGYTCNVRDERKHAGERYGEWESRETIEAVEAALVEAGCDVSLIDVGADIFHILDRRGEHVRQRHPVRGPVPE